MGQPPAKLHSDSNSLQGVATINPPEFTHLETAIRDVENAVADEDSGPAEPNDYSQLRGRIEAVKELFPPLYRGGFVVPFIEKLDQLKKSGFTKILSRDPRRTGEAGLLLDAAQAILQQGERYLEQATDAFQEVVSDLYDGFLSAEDRRGVKAPDKGVIPPLVKWGNPDFGPYTWPIDATESLGLTVGIVNMPPYNSRQGLLAWAALGHETAGHDVLGADTGLREELATAIYRSLHGLDEALAEYWSQRVDETASDVMGILNMGPAAGIALIGYFRGLNAAYGGVAILRNDGSEDDPHPADIMRGYLAAETTALLKFTGKTLWAKAILQETEKDVKRITLSGARLDPTKVHDSAKAVAKAVACTKCESLEGRCLAEIQNWRDTDERFVRRVRVALRTNAPLKDADLGGVYAAHVVAAAVVEVLASGNVDPIFNQMRTVLKAMHDRNPTWGPLLVRQPGSLSRRLGYFRQPPGE